MAVSHLEPPLPTNPPCLADALAFGTLELRVVDSLASPSMGLAADVVAELSLRVTMVVHAAAEVCPFSAPWNHDVFELIFFFFCVLVAPGHGRPGQPRPPL